ncbi:hypothetical protein [Kitasatospora sp. NPDC085879]|uniref:hypothetical protein n=1 Tax=Kitasatospora sp. NPDC085879 TaxID=3154769 RepID=UPI000BB122AF|nr:hypothetical protein [Streptomyces sp. TLI_235]PBC70313.1 hypothetical protein BX265_7719 [Streptomyces sp. TLI_235]
MAPRRTVGVKPRPVLVRCHSGYNRFGLFIAQYPSVQVAAPAPLQRPRRGAVDREHTGSGVERATTLSRSTPACSARP